MINRFGKRYHKVQKKVGAINAGKGALAGIPAADIEKYGPWVRLHIENASDEDFIIYFDAAVLGDDTIKGGREPIPLDSGTGLDLTPYPDGTPDYIFSRILLKNNSATNSSANEVTLEARNY